jgi:hypothetical protein
VPQGAGRLDGHGPRRNGAAKVGEDADTGSADRRNPASGACEASAKAPAEQSRKKAWGAARMTIPEHITLELILSRCKECPDCGAMTHYVGGCEDRPPTIDYAVGGVRKKSFVRRVVWQLGHPDQHLPTGKTAVISSTCTNRRCINPELVCRLTKSAAWRRDAKQGLRYNSPLVIAKTSMKRRAASKLPENGVEDIRTSDESPQALAAKWGVSEAYVYMLRKGLWRKPIGTLFAGLMA